MKITERKYAQLIYESTKGLDRKGVDNVLEKIVSVIKKRGGRIKKDKIIKDFKKVYNQQERIVDAEIVSKEKVTGSELSAIRKKIAHKFKVEEKNVHIEQIEDKTVKGGIIIRIGYEVWDASIKSRLDKLRQSLTA